MKVLWFTNTPSGGVEYLNAKAVGGGWLASLEKLINEDVELYVAFNYARQISEFEYKGTRYYPIPQKNNLVKTILFGKSNNFELKDNYLSIINRIKPDLIHIHGTEQDYYCVQDEVDIPIVVTVQGIVTAIYNKYNSGIEQKYVTAAKLRKFNPFNIRSLIALKTTYRRSVLQKQAESERQNFHKFKYIISKSHWSTQVTSILAPDAKFFRLDNPFRDEFYNTVWDNPSDPQSKKIVIHSTSKDPLYKGLETVCEAITELQQIGYEIEWRVAGISKSDLIVDIVKKKLGKKFPDKGLLLLGKLPAPELINKMAEANMYVMTSHIENSPNNLVEAMFLGMPSIAVFAGGTSSMMKDGAEGLLIQDGDPLALAGAVLEIHNDPERAKSIGAKARETVIARHDKKLIKEKLLSIYNEIVNSGK